MSESAIDAGDDLPVWSDAAGDAAAEGAQSDRLLSQAEIDSLLGLNCSTAGSESLSGMERIISPGIVSYERLPMLEIVLDRLVRIMTISLRNFANTNVEVSLD
ncbi:MAG TPA: flagellar motor switch protein FliM, partial [Acetobacteraceae bacterium]|nr:flagellar motor switch protein FliM [Acetobacteraceae bacterium]